MPPEFDRDAGMDAALDRFWDQEAQGRRGDAGDLDAADAATIRHLHAYDDRPAPSSAFTRQLRESLMHAHAIQVSSGPSSFPLPDGRAGPSWRIGPQALPQAGGRGRWAVAQAATAMLLVATLVLAYFSVFRQNDEPAVIVPAIGTPTPEATPTGDWTTFKGNAARDGRADAGPVGDPVQRWRFQAEGPVGPPPAVVAGVVYAGSGDGFLYALDAESGEERWRFAAGADVGGSPTVADGVVYAADGAGTLYAVDAATGTERWRFASPIATASTPTVVGDLLYVGTGDGALLAIDTTTGEERWRFAVAENGAVNTPAAVDGVVYVGSESGGFVAVDGVTGEERWRGDTGDDALGTAVVAGGIAYIGGSGDGGSGHLYAFDAVTGELRWQIDEALYTPAVENGVAYSASFAGTFAALDTATGAELWRIEMAGPLRPPAVADGILYVPSDGDRAVYALDAATGAELWRFAVDGGIDGAIAVADGSAYVGTLLGGVYAIGGSDTTTLAAPAADAATPVEESAAASAEEGAVAAVEMVWQSTGNPDAPLVYPGDTAVAPDGSVWIIELGGNRFHILEPDGTFRETWGEAGSAPGQFTFDQAGVPDGTFVFDAAGNLYVGDTYNSRVQKFDQGRQFVTEWGTSGRGDGQFVHIAGIAIDGAGNVVVCDRDRADCQVFASDGAYLSAFDGSGSEAGPFVKPSYMSSDHEGNLYLPDYGHDHVWKLGPDGGVLQTIGTQGNGPGQLSGANDVAVSADGTIYVADANNGRIQVFDPSGRYLAEWTGEGTDAGPFDAPAGVAADGEGNAYVTDIAGGHVTKFRLPSPAGMGTAGTAPTSAEMATPAAQAVAPDVEQLWETRGGPDGLDFPRGLAIDPDGNLWVADASSRFQIFSQDGSYLETWGEPGADDGQFNLTSANGDVVGNAAFAPDGSLYVSDAGNRRIQQFDGQRNFVAAWDGDVIGADQTFAPTSVAVDTSGLLYVLDNANDTVRVFDGDMTPVRDFRIHEALGFSAEEAQDSTNFIAVDSEGNVYASSYLRTAVLKFDSSGTFVAEIGGPGAGDGQFTQPVDIAFDETGNLLVADLDSGVIEVFAPDGAHVATWGSFGSDPGQFAGPAGIVANGQDVYVAEADGSRVQKFRVTSPSSTAANAPVATPNAGGGTDGPAEFVWQVDAAGVPFAQVVDVAVAPHGDIWIVDGEANQIHIFKPSGAHRKAWGTSGSGEGEFSFGPNAAVAFDGEGNAYVMDRGNNRVQKFDADRNFVTAWGELGNGDGQFNDGRMSDLAVDPDGNVYVLDYRRRDVQKFSSDGMFLYAIDGPGNGERFSADVARIGVDAAGNLYVPEGARVHVFDPDGTPRLTIMGADSGGAQFGYTIDATADAAGNIYVSDAETNRIQVFDANGQFLTAWGGEGAAPGQFTSAEALALDGAGHLYVLDWGNNRVQKFRLLPPLGPEPRATPAA